MSSLVLVTGPTTDPVSLAEARAQLRKDLNDEDALIAGYLIAARQFVETYLGRALIQRTFDLKLDYCWPRDCRGCTKIVLPRPPLVSVTSVSYVDTTGTTQVLASNQYQVSLGDVFGIVVPAYGITWPALRNQVDAIIVRFVTGYGVGPDSVPEPIRQAILLLTGHFFENREPVPSASFMRSVEMLLSKYQTEIL